MLEQVGAYWGMRREQTSNQLSVSKRQCLHEEPGLLFQIFKTSPINEYLLWPRSETLP